MNKEKIKTRKCIECKEEFYSNYDKSEVCPTCHYKNKQKEKDQRIAELEEQLKNMPKFKVGQEVWAISDIEKKPFLDKVVGVQWYESDVYYNLDFLCDMAESDYVFATEEEAQAKLKELQGE